MPTNLGAGIGAALAAVLSIETIAGALLLADVGQSEPLTFVQMLGICVLGSIGGTVGSFAVFTPIDDVPRYTAQRYFAKISASFFSGVCLAPMIVDYMDWEARPFYALGSSFLMSLFLVSALHPIIPPVIHGVAPILTEWSKRWIKKRLPKADDQEDEK